MASQAAQHQARWRGPSQGGSRPIDTYPIDTYLVTAEEMQQIEGRLFSAGMPVAALMEKVSARLTDRFCDWLTSQQSNRQRSQVNAQLINIGVFVGPGHNGGDALVMARELHHLGYRVCVYQPFERCKPLTAQHTSYAKHIGIAFTQSLQALLACDAIIDGGFGFGLTRPITGAVAADIELINQQRVPVFSVDLPSGIHTDTGKVMGVALKATHTACLGLWKRGFMQAEALAYLGECELVEFDIPPADVAAVVGEVPAVQRLIEADMLAALPLDRSVTAHKYKAGHLLMIAGSRQYAGAALLAGLGAIASGVGMLTLAVPESIRLSLLPALPEALLIGCEETPQGAIANLPASLDLTAKTYGAIALGPGLTATVPSLLTQVLSTDCRLILDADGLNLLAKIDVIAALTARTAPTVLTPHLGEFKRLFPDIHAQPSAQTRAEKMSPKMLQKIPGEMALQAATASGATVLLKGPRSAIATGNRLWFNPTSTPALARGGSGDVLTGLMGGLVAAANTDNTPKEAPIDAVLHAVLGAVWWHSQAALHACEQRTVLGVNPLQLAQHLNPTLSRLVNLTPH